MADEKEALSIFIETISKELNVKENHVHQCTQYLEEGLSVPFIVRYRSSSVGNMDGSQAHTLEEKYKRHQSLSNTRIKILKAAQDSNSLTRELRRMILRACNASELDDLYQPFKPPSKGTLAERASLIPGIADIISNFIQKGSEDRLLAFIGRDNKMKDSCFILLTSYFSKLPELLSEAKVLFKSRGVITSKRILSTTAKSAPKKDNENVKATKVSSMNSSKDIGSLATYENFAISMRQLKPHQTLALARGKEKNILSVNITLDDKEIGKRSMLKKIPGLVPGWHKLSHQGRSLLNEASEEAYNKSIKKRASGWIWREKVELAQKRGIQVFCDNLSNALLSPGLPFPGAYVLSVDPGYRAGCKCALLKPDGSLLKQSTETSLFTLYPLQNYQQAVDDLVKKLEKMKSKASMQGSANDLSISSGAVSYDIRVALGDGHGSIDARKLVEDALEKFYTSDTCKKDEDGVATQVKKKSKLASGLSEKNTNSNIPKIEISVVREAGASVWSADEDAMKEFPNIAAASLGAVSIGRRLQEPLGEFVKIPPKSLGLGMYQHDLCPKSLDAALKDVTIDCVAIVGVDVNTASEKLLSLVPGLNAKLARSLVDARPIKSRADLLKVKGIGPVAYKNCAGFLQVRNGIEFLDATLVHPEDYHIAMAVLELCTETSATQSKKKHSITSIKSCSPIEKLRSLAEKNGFCSSQNILSLAVGTHIDNNGSNNIREESLSTFKKWSDDVVSQVASSKLFKSSSTNKKLKSSSVSSASSSSSSSSGGEGTELEKKMISSVLVLLLNSGLDPRQQNTTSSSSITSSSSLEYLPLALRTSLKALADACPVRGVRGDVVNVTDFGAFINLGQGVERDGLLHKSRFSKDNGGGVSVGQSLEVDVLSVDVPRGRIDIGLPMKKRKSTSS